MLVLTRRVNEAVVINDSVTIRVLGVGDDGVRLAAESIAGLTEKCLPPPNLSPSESFDLPGNVRVRVISVCSGRARLGFQAPREVAFFRAEQRQPPVVQPPQTASPGEPPPVVVEVVPLQAALDDAHAFLAAGQREHVKDLWQRLGCWGDNEALRDLRIGKIQNFWELKVKGSVLGRLNVRVFFAWQPARREVVILGVVKKQKEGQTPRHLVIRMQHRLRAYLGKVAE